MTMITPSYLGETIEYSSLHACRSTLEDPTGAVSIMSLVPTPQDPNTSVAYIHSIFTVPEYRGRGFASQILNSILDYCKCAKIKRVQLSASDAGRSLYEKSGFKPADSSMVLNFE